MRILVTNDDGIQSNGIWSLAKSLQKIAEVKVVAPDRDKSGTGTSMTIVDVVRADEFVSPVEGIQAFSVQGTPADSVILATETLFSEPFDLVFAGINRGANLGLDILNSGTVGGALNGYYREITSVAISAHYSPTTVDINFDTAAEIAATVASELHSNQPEKPQLLIINVPDSASGVIEGVETTRIGPRAYLENIEVGRDGRRTHYWIRHNKPVLDEPPHGTDLWAIENNRVSITPIDLSFSLGTENSTAKTLTRKIASSLSLYQDQ